MSNTDSPAERTGGPVTVPGLDELPEKMRVHALAKLIGRPSREVLVTLAGLGIETKSVQSSITRKDAEQVVAALVPEALAPEPAAPDSPAPASLADTPEAPAAAPAPAQEASAQARAPGRRASTRKTPTRRSSVRSAPVQPAEESPVAPVADVATEQETPAAERPAPPVPVFAPPTPLFQPPARPSRAQRTAEAPAVEPEAAAAPAQDDAEPTPSRRRRTRSRRVEEVVPEPEETVEETEETEPDTDDTEDESGDGANRRRRRRGRRGRGRGRGPDEAEDESEETGAADTDESDDAVGDAESDESEDGDDSDNEDSDSDDSDSDDSDREEDGEEADSTSRRRRRRRRRRGSGDDAATEDDPPGTVTRIRPPREARTETEGDGVQSVRGSTRLEAKRQRRRDGRDAGRRRVPILTEAEFLARREAVDRTMVVRERGDRIEIAVLEDEVLVEHFIADRGNDGSVGDSLVGNIYLGRVQNVLPSMEAAFVDIGRGRNAVLYAGEVDWDAAGLGGKARRIEQALSSGDSVLVQVTKDPIGHKGARLTTQISLAGRFLVYVPSGGAAGISRKLPDVERKRLKDMLKEIVPGEAGVIIRTASEGVSQEALERDVRRLQAQWDVVKTRSEQTGPNRPKAPTLLYEEPDLLIKVVRDQFNEDFTKLIVEGDDAWDTLAHYVGHVAPELADRLHRHVGTGDVFGQMRIDEQLLKALDRKVWLPSGGTLVIDRTEAMTVIDVNTGKFTGSGGNLEETVTRNNLEAAEEIVRQLRLRDIGGIIVIDFIDMVLEANRDLVLRRLTECLARDRTRHQVAEVTSLGLVQMTRKRVGGGLLEHFSTPCEHCRGRGIIVSTEPVQDRKDDERPAPRGSDRDTRRTRGRTRRDDSGPRENGPQSGPQNGSMASGVAAVAAAAELRTSPGPRSLNGHAAPVPEIVTEVVAETVAATDTATGAEVTGPVAASTVAAEPVVPEGVTETTPESVAVATVEAADDASAAPALSAPAPRRRRGRVTRTAGAPAAAAAGSAPAVAVVTVPARSVAVEEPPAVAVPVAAQVVAQPEPTVTRPRRARRAASRPAGPPADTAGADPE